MDDGFCFNDQTYRAQPQKPVALKANKPQIYVWIQKGLFRQERLPP